MDESSLVHIDCTFIKALQRSFTTKEGETKQYNEVQLSIDPAGYCSFGSWSLDKNFPVGDYIEEPVQKVRASFRIEAFKGAPRLVLINLQSFGE